LSHERYAVACKIEFVLEETLAESSEIRRGGGENRDG
jgi:hypothetical protein